MVDIDIDKILEKSEKIEKQSQKQQKMVLLAILAVIIISFVVIVLLSINYILGDKATTYFPLKSDYKFVFNKKNMSPEEWEILNKLENINNYQCKVLNIIDKGTFLTKQEYYFVDKKAGIIRLAISDNYGKKIKSGFKLLPARIKNGMEFNAGKIKDKIIKAKVEGKETLSLPVGMLETYKVHYMADTYFDEIVWFAKDMGIVKKINNINKEELNIITMGKK